MADHSENSLRAVIKSLRDVVGPAVDQGDPLAQQQLALSLGYLEFLRSRLSHLHARAVFELEHHLRVGRRVLDRLGDTHDAAGLTRSVADGDRLAALPGADDDALHRATAAIAAQLRAVLNSELDERVLVDIERTIVAAMAERITVERAWYLPMGFDPDPSSAVPLGEALPARAG